MKIYVINLKKDKKRREFQKQQLQELCLDYEIVEATTINDITPLYSKFQYHWQRPLREVEVACYFSHQKLWKRVLQNSEPALILEDDALICKELPEILNFCKKLTSVDHISLESVGRKKLLGNSSITLPIKPFKLLPLLIDRNGAAGYILFPSGAKKLLEHEQKNGIALADAQITSCFTLNSYQLQPACVIQMDQCQKFGLTSPVKTLSNISTCQKSPIPKGKYLQFKRKRILHQVKLALREIKYFRAKRLKVDVCDNLKALYG